MEICSQFIPSNASHLLYKQKEGMHNYHSYFSLRKKGYAPMVRN